MKTTLYLVRHGQSEGNQNRIFLGHLDRSLSDLGRRQAERAAGYLRTIRPDVIYSSDLKRALETAEPVAAYWNLPIHKRKDLREIDAGLWSGLPYDTIATRYSKGWNSWKNDPVNAFCDGGETVAQMSQRFTEAVLDIARAHPDQTVFLFTHATVLRALSVFCGYHESFPLAPAPTNASTTKILFEDGKLKLVSYSYDNYMKDDVSGSFLE